MFLYVHKFHYSGICKLILQKENEQECDSKLIEQRVE